MRQIFNLVKKDFLLAKNYILVVFLFSIGVPILMFKEGPIGSSSIAYGTLVLMLSFMSYHMISMEEMKEEGMVYVQTTPISNTSISLAKFAVVFLVFIIISCIYFFLSKIKITNVGPIGIKDILFAFLLIELFFSIYIPLTFKLGYVKLQMVSAGIIFTTPFMIGLVSKKMNGITKILVKIGSIPDGLLISLSVLIAIFILLLSINRSSKILDSKEY